MSRTRLLVGALALPLALCFTACAPKVAGVDGVGGGSGGGGGGGGGPIVRPDASAPTATGCTLPAEAALEEVSKPTTVVGSGSPASCTSAAVVAAVAAGGVITFDCGPEPLTIVLDEPARVFNDASPEVVIDGGGLITLSGAGTHRVLYMNTCDQELTWTTDHCNDQDHPRLTVQNISFIDGFDESEDLTDGGGAIFARGGRFKAINANFYGNRCAAVGQDVGGGAIRVFDQYQDLPVYIVGSTFGGAAGAGNICANGGALSSIGVSWSIFDSLFSYNEATGNGGNPKEPGTPGGGSGGAIYNDGNTMTLSLCGSVIEHNRVNAYGQGIFFISNNHDGTLVLEKTTIRDNEGGSWHALPGISMHDDTKTVIDDESVLE